MPYKGEKFKDEHVDFIRQANVVMDAVQLSQTQAVIDTERQYGLSKSEIAAFEDYDADYALFVVVRASRASGGRHAVAFLSALALGVATQQLHDATFRVGLFDMRDGQLAYANFDPNALAELGNVTKASPKRWQKAIGYLLREFPL